MHGDFSRRTYDPAKGYRAVLLQQGRVLLDADVNEQADITAHHDEVRLLDVVGRTGGPVPPGAARRDGSTSGPFAIVGVDEAWTTDGAIWSDLRILPGRYYVDGVLAEAETDAPEGGWPLADQPHLPALAEPVAGTDQGDRYAVWLDVWQRQVTRDEDDSLLEPALGGPDTTTRSRTVWQVRVEQVDPTADCATLHRLAATPRTPRRMVASLQPPAEATSCEISALGGYQRLENQLYRVQVHTAPDPDADPAADPDAHDGTFVWSRENGSVVARVLHLGATAAPATVTLTLDRTGMDDDLGFGEGVLVELTSPDLELRGEPGFLGTVGRPDGVVLPVTWSAGAPASLDAVGVRPVLRRWEGRGRLGTVPVPLEGGIEVAFPDAPGGTARTGDHWLIPARTVRLAYGLTQLSGTIEWPSRPRTVTKPDGSTETVDVPLPQPPAGPVVHRAPLALLARTAGGVDAPDVWHPGRDCRDLFSPVTAAAIDLLGGDGQEALPGEFLPAPVRVALRAGAHPLPGAVIRFSASDGGVLRAAGEELGPDGGPVRRLPTPSVDVTTDGAGTAGVFWQLQQDGPTTQTLAASALDGAGNETGTTVIVSGRLSVASQVGWTPRDADQHFPAPTTVQDVVDRLVGHHVLRLLGGDGQSVRGDGDVVPQQVRVVVEDGVGALAGVRVFARAGDDTAPGLVEPAVEGDPAPASVPGTPGAVVDAPTDDDGVARFWWQPAFPGRTSAVLELSLAPAAGAPVRVSANLDTGGGTPPASGLHLTVVRLAGRRPLLEGAVIGPDDLADLELVLDGDVDLGLLQDSRAVRVELDLPWPDSQATPWFFGPTTGTFTVTLDAVLKGDGPSAVWVPLPPAFDWLRGVLFKGLETFDRREVTGRVVVDGWSVLERSDAEARRPLNCHAERFVADGRPLFRLPTDDATPAGQFALGFRLRRERQARDFTVPDVTGQRSGPATQRMTNVGFTTAIRFTVRLNAAQGTVLGTEPKAGTVLAEGSEVTLVVAARRLPG
jgi:hypothetical protein